MIIKNNDDSAPGDGESADCALQFSLPAALAEHAGYLIGRTADLMRARLNTVCEQHHLSLRHIGVLVVLAARGAARQTDLTEAVYVDRTTIMKLIDDLEAAGYAQRERDLIDRRANAVTLTRKGRALLKSELPKMQLVEREFMSPLSDVEQANLLSLLRRLVAMPAESPATSRSADRR